MHRVNRKRLKGAASWNTRTTYQSRVFQQPCCLIENGSDGKLKVCPMVMNQLKEIELPLNVVAITGTYRTGKSYLLNYLAGKRKGFILGSTIEAATKGIWVWCRPHPERQNEVLLLMDTEGLVDIDKGDEENDSLIFTLSVLLSSTLVYNSMSRLDQEGVSKLHYVKELTERIKASDTSENEDGREFYKIFPNFVWVVMDFTLPLEKEGPQITSDEYLSDVLKLKKGRTRHEVDYNRPRQCIQNFFREKKCFIFPPPLTDWKKMEELEKLPDSELESKFLQEAETFCTYIYERSFPKTANSQPINGRKFCHLLETYLNFIQSGAIPCVENAVKSMAERENAEAVKVSFNLYENQMKEQLLLESNNTEAELSKAHLDCSRQALERFMSMSTLDEKQKYQCELKEKIRQKYEEICSKRDYDLGGSGCEQTEELNMPLPGKKMQTRKRRHARMSDSRSGKKSDPKDKEMLVEIEDANQHLVQLNKKLEQEKENMIQEKKRLLEQRDDESKRTNNIILQEHSEELKREIEKMNNELREIQQGGSSYGNYLMRGGSAFLGMIQGALAGWNLGLFSGIPAVAAVTSVLGSRFGGIIGLYSKPAGKEALHLGQVNEEEQERASTLQKELEGKTEDLQSSDWRMEIHEMFLDQFCKEKLEVFLSVKRTDSVLKNLLEVILAKNSKEALCIIMAYISKKWKEDFGDNTIAVWLGLDHREGKAGEVVLVCFHLADIVSKFSQFLGLPMIYRRFDEIEMEPLENRLQKIYKRVSFNTDDAAIIKLLINEYGEHLFEIHSNLEAISASSVKSRKNGITEQTSILLYCRLKGVIPYGEEFFPEQLKFDKHYYPTDIREGFFSLGMNGTPRQPNNPHPHFLNDPLRMGCSIGASGFPFAGTLGPFVRLPPNDIGFLTCAHVLGINRSSTQTQIVQPADIESGLPDGTRLCGTFVKEKFDPQAKIGVDAALVRIDQTKRRVDPGSFVWMGSHQLSRSGFSQENSPSFEDGKVIGHPDLQKLGMARDVHKFGRSTGLTQGLLVLDGPMFKVHNASLSLPQGMPTPYGYSSNTFIMKGQFLIQNVGNEPFFISGDSGAGVYVVKKKSNGTISLELIGIAIGSITSGECAMTPIGSVLEALGLEDSSVITEGDMETDS